MAHAGEESCCGFPAFNLISHLTAVENVALPLVVRGVPERDARAHALAALEQAGLAQKERARPGQLSGGEQQRVAIARAVASESDYILADEPTGNLDSANADLVADLLPALSRKGKGVLIATHNSELAARADRVIRLRDGKVVEESGPGKAQG